MQTTHPRIAIRDPGDLIAAVPYLLGFRPTESVVVCVYAGALRSHLALCLRADIPPPDLYFSLADQLRTPILRANSCGVSVIVVSDDAAEDPLPHRDLVGTLGAFFAAAGVIIHNAYWTSAIDANVTWRCYDDLERTGLIPDPGCSELAATAACMGTVTFDSKADIRATLEPADSGLLASRAERIAAALRLDQDESHAHQVIEDLIQRTREGPWTLNEEQLVDVAVALSNVRVRDGCLRPEVTSIGLPIEDVWSELTRELPAPYRAEAACLLAVTAFLRGDGVFAGIAVEAALEAKPEHGFATLLRYTMDLGLPPDVVAASIARAFLDPPLDADPHDADPPTDAPPADALPTDLSPADARHADPPVDALPTDLPCADVPPTDLPRADARHAGLPVDAPPADSPHMDAHHADPSHGDPHHAEPRHSGSPHSESPCE